MTPSFYEMVFILGAGGFAKEVAWVLKENRCSRLFYLSDDPEQRGNSYCWGTVVGSIEDHFNPLPDYAQKLYICGVGSPSLKRRFVGRVQTEDTSAKWAGPVVHPSVAICSSFSNVGKGTVVCANSSITCDITIGNHVAINLNCTIGHDVVIKDFCNLSPGVHISGHSVLEEGVDIGTGAVILPGIHIGENAVIGAGAVVTKDIPANSVSVGIPSRVIKLKEAE